jgi:hypothetical protein
VTKITRDVVTDLWPLYESGEASRDTKALVDDFLAGDHEFARTLRARPELEAPVIVPPNAEAVALRRTRDLVRGSSWLRGLRLVALALTALAIKRLFTDVTWSRVPTVFIADAVMAAIAWASYGMLLRWYRQRSLQ